MPTRSAARRRSFREEVVPHDIARAKQAELAQRQKQAEAQLARISPPASNTSN